MLTVYGGKITTYRRLAEDALGKLAHFFQLHRRWTATTPLPGGDFLWDAIETRVAQTLRAWPFLSEAEAWRLVRAYGTRVERVLGDAKRREDIAPFFGPLSAAEVRYLMKHEWARTPDDVLWRRSKLGLKLSKAEKEALAQFMARLDKLCLAPFSRGRLIGRLSSADLHGKLAAQVAASLPGRDRQVQARSDAR